MLDATFAPPDLTVFRHIDELGLVAVGQRLELEEEVAVDWGIRALGVELGSVSGVARALGISWHTANDAIMERAEPTVLKDPHHLEGVEAIGVDEHLWRHTPNGSKYVTVIIDLTPCARAPAPPGCWT